MTENKLNFPLELVKLVALLSKNLLEDAIQHCTVAVVDYQGQKTGAKADQKLTEDSREKFQGH